MTTNTAQRSFFYRHRKILSAIGLVLGTAIGAGYSAYRDARAENPKVVEVPAADVIGLRQDIGDLRGDIRDERKARESLSAQFTEFNGRLGRLEGAASVKAKTK